MERLLKAHEDLLFRPIPADLTTRRKAILVFRRICETLGPPPWPQASKSRLGPPPATSRRVALRLGLVPRGTPVAEVRNRLESLLPEDWTRGDLRAHRQALRRLAARYCFAREPDCQRCPLLELCPTGQSKLPEAA